MRARVKENYRFQSIKAAGREYVKTEWRGVPAEDETAVLNDERLEIDKSAEMTLEAKRPGRNPGKAREL